MKETTGRDDISNKQITANMTPHQSQTFLNTPHIVADTKPQHRVSNSHRQEILHEDHERESTEHHFS